MRHLFFLVLLCSSISSSAQYFDTLHIRYAIGVAVLQPADKKLLDSLAQHNGGRKLLIYSYADYLGSESPNQHLSDNRAAIVKAYLLKSGVDPAMIMECSGLGQVAGSGSREGDPASRRTDIFIRRNVKAVVPAPAVAPRDPKPGGRITIRDTTRITPIDVDQLQVNETLRLNNIEFYPGMATVIPSGYAELDNLYNVLYDHPALKIRLEGHVCCCVYPDGYFSNTPTWGLSVERARVVYEHLIKRGIAPERMQYAGFGRTRPIRDNERTVEEGQVNRRVEVRILEK